MPAREVGRAVISSKTDCDADDSGHRLFDIERVTCKSACKVEEIDPPHGRHERCLARAHVP